jgi:hypothetical protein
MKNPDYLHVPDGRVRTRVSGLKRSGMKAPVISDELLNVKGVPQVAANTVTVTTTRWFYFTQMSHLLTKFLISSESTILQQRLSKACRKAKERPHVSKRFKDFT